MNQDGFIYVLTHRLYIKELYVAEVVVEDAARRALSTRLPQTSQPPSS